MPSSYTNADLKRFDRTPGNYTDYGPAGPPAALNAPAYDARYEGNIDQLLADAKRTLASANQFDYSIDPTLNDPNRRPARPEDFTERHPVLRSITSPLNAAGRTAELSALGLGFTPAAAVSPVLAGLGAALSAPDVLRRAIIPENDESRLGAVVEGGLDVANARPLRSAISNIASASPSAQRVLRALNSVFAENPNATVPRIGRAMNAATDAQAAEAAARTGELSQARMLARQLDSTGYAPGAVQKITGLHPNAPRSISTAQAISRNNDPISELMSGTSRNGGPLQGLMDVLAQDAPAVSSVEPAAEQTVARAARAHAGRYEGRPDMAPGQFQDQLRASAGQQGLKGLLDALIAPESGQTERRVQQLLTDFHRRATDLAPR